MSTQDIFNLTDTWNAAGTTFTAIKMNVTDTASAAGSNLMDLQVGGSSKFKVEKDGRLDTTGIAYFAGNLYLGMGSTLQLGAGDTVLARDDADTLAQRRSTNAQAFRVYNTYTDASNYERAIFEWSSNTLRVGTTQAGTGVARAMNIVTGGNAIWQFTTAGHLMAVTDNTYDIGASNATRPRNVHIAGYVSIGDGITAPGAGTGQARIYVDTADGDLKVVFADGTVKTIVTDT